MNKSQKLFLSVVMLCAVMLVAVLSYGYFSDRHTLSSLKQELDSSTAAWKQTNEDKLAVQKELKAAKEELREAELTLTESEERAAELSAEIATLEQEIKDLKEKLPAE